MQLFKFSFEESEYIVDEAYVKRTYQPSKKKRFIGMFLLALLLYIGLVMLPMLMQILMINNPQNLKLNFLNIPILVLIVLFYSSYVFLSVKNFRRNFIKKYLTYFYITLSLIVLMFIFEIVELSQFLEGGVFVPVLSFSIFIITIYYTQYRLHKGIKQSVKNKEMFNSIAYILSEKVGIILLILGSSGLPALIAIANIYSNGSVNRGIDAILEPFIPTIIYLGVYFLMIESYKGYYVVKYFEQYRVKFGYSIEEWYGKNSKEYKESLKNK
ncbi:MAG: beta-carotene 15,15'-monooxygenase [Streptococcus sp.]|uniref:beta-carotene 15,15'-monooxygenase n=1 Tax=Streptococcus sp. TaxID=1306 RepID=UPI00258B17C4|nr:beta-carotene 15,15'-monooxygenase [Streptococcus sp.]MCR5052894.1 beta-carotene 15,15'-monooxygenase [Streptococcus sp.]